MGAFADDSGRPPNHPGRSQIDLVIWAAGHAALHVGDWDAILRFLLGINVQGGGHQAVIGLTQDAAGGPWVNVWNGFGDFSRLGASLRSLNLHGALRTWFEGWKPLAKSLLWSRWEPIIAPMP